MAFLFGFDASPAVPLKAPRHRGVAEGRALPLPSGSRAPGAGRRLARFAYHPGRRFRRYLQAR